MESVTAELGKEKYPVKNFLNYIIPTLNLYISVCLSLIYAYGHTHRVPVGWVHTCACVYVYKMKGYMCKGKGIKRH